MASVDSGGGGGGAPLPGRWWWVRGSSTAAAPTVRSGAGSGAESALCQAKAPAAPTRPPAPPQPAAIAFGCWLAVRAALGPGPEREMLPGRAWFAGVPSGSTSHCQKKPGTPHSTMAPSKATLTWACRGRALNAPAHISTAKSRAMLLHTAAGRHSPRSKHQPRVQKAAAWFQVGGVRPRVSNRVKTRS